MRIVPVTGDLPAVALPPPAPAPVVQPAAAAPPLPAVTAAAAADPGGGTAQERRQPGGKAYFDPPLIAQRAVLGLPVGPLVAEYARAEGLDFGAAWAAVDREMPGPREAPGS